MFKENLILFQLDYILDVSIVLFLIELIKKEAHILPYYIFVIS
jgi:hypothetical protein